jgi:hypothetical protein
VAREEARLVLALGRGGDCDGRVEAAELGQAGGVLQQQRAREDLGVLVEENVGGEVCCIGQSALFCGVGGRGGGRLGGLLGGVQRVMHRTLCVEAIVLDWRTRIKVFRNRIQVSLRIHDVPLFHTGSFENVTVRKVLKLLITAPDRNLERSIGWGG